MATKPIRHFHLADSVMLLFHAVRFCVRIRSKNGT